MLAYAEMSGDISYEMVMEPSICLNKMFLTMMEVSVRVYDYVQESLMSVW